MFYFQKFKGPPKFFIAHSIIINLQWVNNLSSKRFLYENILFCAYSHKTQAFLLKTVGHSGKCSIHPMVLYNLTEKPPYT